MAYCGWNTENSFTAAITMKNGECRSMTTASSLSFSPWRYSSAAYGEDDVNRIMNTEGMIRAERKIRAVISNAGCFQKIRKEFGSFSDYLWSYSDGKMILYNHHAEGYIPVSNGLSERISKDLKKRGFRFLGSVTIYSHLQCCGIINDHDENCPRYKELTAQYPCVHRNRYLEKKVSYYGD